MKWSHEDAQVSHPVISMVRLYEEVLEIEKHIEGNWETSLPRASCMGGPRIVSDCCPGELNRVVPKDIQAVTVGLERILQRLNDRLHLGF